MILELEPYGLGTKKATVTNLYDLGGPLPTTKLNVVTATGASYDEVLGGRPTISGDDAFKLYDTYGFPLDLTELMARERGLSVDVAGFDLLMEQQRTRARAAQKKETISVSGDDALGRTTFVGYEQPETTARVLESLSLKGKVGVVLDTTACYAEMGGQVGDTGELSQNGSRWRVANTQKAGNAIVHVIADGTPPEAGVEVRVASTSRDVARLSGITPSRICCTGRCTKLSRAMRYRRGVTSGRRS